MSQEERDKEYDKIRNGLSKLKPKESATEICSHGLDQADDTTFARPMEEDVEISNQRKRLIEQKRKLSDAIQRIDDLDLVPPDPIPENVV
ncbi:hypothetical protein JX266_013803 [Neoarthrinium moseri]|nr:hypothetical protein JX266_013803 [Neoarthrinium moseri]